MTNPLNRRMALARSAQVALMLGGLGLLPRAALAAYPTAAFEAKTIADLMLRAAEKHADKVAVNSAAVARPDLVSDIAERFGSQCCVASVDARATAHADRRALAEHLREDIGAALADRA